VTGPPSQARAYKCAYKKKTRAAVKRARRLAKRKEWRFGKLGAASPVRRIVKDGRSV
jgi:hypothetical protein